MDGYVVTVLILLLAIVSNSSTEDGEDEPDVFEPTSEWQVVQEGQSIPRGLHVRMNLETGVKEAKFMEDGDKDATQNGVSVQGAFGDPRRPNHYGQSDRRGIINKSRKVFSKEELANMLKHINDDGPAADKIHYLEDLSSDDKSASTVPVSLQELQDLVTITTEVQVMLSHLQVLVDEDSSRDDVLNALREIEYFVHQIDNARDFDVVGGVVVVVRLLNSSDVDIVVASLLVLGACVQSNPSVQVAALSCGTLPSLVRLIKPSQPHLVQRRALFALGALLRGHPTAANEFIVSNNGLDILSEGVEERSDIVFAKIVTLLTDLLMMEEPLELTKSELRRKLVDSGWCDHTPKLVYSKDMSMMVDGVMLMYQLMEGCVYTEHLDVMNKILSQLNSEDFTEVYNMLVQIIHTTRSINKEL